MNIANELMALNEGIPAILVFNNENYKVFELIPVEGKNKKEVISMIEKATKQNTKDSKGKYLKVGVKDEL